mmetsp:Transcript_58646/g.124448  ORF Transcript_58646/g.124448 Transcript_58646/m.124448 type:complete len:200 (-) Transcript_58646:226-825(-)
MLHQRCHAAWLRRLHYSYGTIQFLLYDILIEGIFRYPKLLRVGTTSWVIQHTKGSGSLERRRHLRVIFDAVSDFIPSRTAHDFDVLLSLCFYETMSISVLHRAAVVDDPYPKWKVLDGLGEGGGVAAREALGHELLNSAFGDRGEFAIPSRAGKLVVARLVRRVGRREGRPRLNDRSVGIVYGHGEWDSHWNDRQRVVV